jgi:hypothetical protein
LDDAPEVTAQTSVAELRGLVADLTDANEAVTEAAEAAGGIELGALNSAFAGVENIAEALTGATAGNAAATINPALEGVRTAYAGIGESAGCE